MSVLPLFATGSVRWVTLFGLWCSSGIKFMSSGGAPWLGYTMAFP